MAPEFQIEEEWVSTACEQVKKIETNLCMSGVQKHTPMHMYAFLKANIAQVTFCVNKLGCRQPLGARRNALRTRLY